MNSEQPPIDLYSNAFVDLSTDQRLAAQREAARRSCERVVLSLMLAGIPCSVEPMRLYASGDNATVLSLEYVNHCIRKLAAKPSVLHLHYIPESSPNLTFVIIEQALKYKIPVFISGISAGEEQLLKVRFRHAVAAFSSNDIFKASVRFLLPRKIRFRGVLEFVLAESANFIDTAQQQKIQATITQLLHDRAEESAEVLSESEVFGAQILNRLICRYSGIVHHLVKCLADHSSQRRDFGMSIVVCLLEKVPVASVQAAFAPYISEEIPPKIKLEQLVAMLSASLLHMAKFSSADLPSVEVNLQTLLLYGRDVMDTHLMGAIDLLPPESEECSTFFTDRFIFCNQLIERLTELKAYPPDKNLPLEIRKFFYQEICDVSAAMDILRSQQSSDALQSDYMQQMQNYLRLEPISLHYKKIFVILQRDKNINLNPLLSQGFELTRVQMHEIAESIITFLCPQIKKLRRFHKKVSQVIPKSSQATAQSNTVQTPQTSLREFSLQILVRARYLMVSEQSVSVLERRILLAGKSQLGILEEEADNPILPIHAARKIGYNPIQYTANFRLEPQAFNADRLHEVYKGFLEHGALHAMRDIIRNNAVANLIKVHGESTFAHLYALLCLRKNIYIGYHQFYRLCQDHLVFNHSESTQMGYDKTAKSKVFDAWSDPYYRKTSLEDLIGSANPHLFSSLVTSMLHGIKKLGQFPAKLRQQGQGNAEMAKPIEFFATLIEGLHKQGVYDLYSRTASRTIALNEHIPVVVNRMKRFISDHYHSTSLNRSVRELALSMPKPYAFLAIFNLGCSLDFEEQSLQVHISEDSLFALPGVESLGTSFAQYLDEASKVDSLLSIALKELEYIYALMQTYQGIWVSLQHNSALFWAIQIMCNHSKQISSITSIGHIARLKDTEKCFIYGKPRFQISDYSPLLGEFPKDAAFLHFNDFAAMCNEFATALQHQELYRNIFYDINYFLSTIPSVKYASADLKELRCSLREAEDMLGFQLVEMNSNDIQRLSKIIIYAAELFPRILEAESHIAHRYRFLRIAVERISFAQGHLRKDQVFSLFAKGVHENFTTTAGSRFKLFQQLSDTVAFLTLLKSKPHLFIYPSNDQVSTLERCLMLLLKIRGLNSNTFIDTSELSISSQESLAKYIPDTQIINLQIKRV